MQLGSFKSILGGFLSQLGFGTWPSEVTPPPTVDFPIASVSETPPRRRTWLPHTAWTKPIGLPVPPAVVAPTQAQWVFGGQPPRRARLAVERGQIVAPLRVADVTAAVPALSWRPSVPDRVWTRAAPPRGDVVLTFASAIPFLDPSRFGWRGSLPDRVWKKAPVPGQFPHAVLISPSVFPIPETSWRGFFPDRVPSRSWIRGLSGSVIDPNPLPNAAAPALSWQGYQPVRVWAAPRPPDRLWHVQVLRHTPFAPDFVSGLVIAPAWIPRRAVTVNTQRAATDRFEIVVPDIRQDWQGYPADRPGRRFVPRIPGVFTAAVVERAVSPVDWYSGGAVPHPRLRRPAVAEDVWPPPPGALILVGQQLAWHPQLPTVIRILTTPFTGPTMVIPPPIIAAGVGCVELDDLVVTAPRLLASAVTAPGLKDVVVTAPGLVQGEVC